MATPPGQQPPGWVPGQPTWDAGRQMWIHPQQNSGPPAAPGPDGQTYSGWEQQGGGWEQGASTPGYGGQQPGWGERQGYIPTGYPPPQGYQDPAYANQPPGSHPQPGPLFGPGYLGAAPPPGMGSRVPIVVGVVAALVIALAVGGFLVLRHPAANLTYNGQKIQNLTSTLRAGEVAVATIVSTRHGVKADDTRCYVAQPRSVPSGTKKSDIDHSLYCGPVLFVDGDTNNEYLTLALTSSPGQNGAVVLGPAGTSVPADPVAANAVTLSRPDKKSPPAGTGGLLAPAPTKADPNYFGSPDLGGTTLPAAGADAVIGSLTGGVRILALGTVSRFGHGDDARSTPDGQKLIGFTIAAAPDTDGDTPSYGALELKISVTGAADRTVGRTGNAFVVGVPVSATTADLVATESGVTQRVSLLTGQPAATNLAVGRRKNHTANVAKTFNVSVGLRDDDSTGSQAVRIDVTTVDLNYWANDADLTWGHARSAANALLYVKVQYTYTGSPTAPFTYAGSPGPFGLPANYQKIQLPNGTVVPGRDVDPDDNYFHNVYEVPATFTTGTLIIGGAVTNAAGITVTTPTTKVVVTLPAG